MAAIAAMVARAFADDPFYRWLIPGDGTRVARLTALHAAVFPHLLGLSFCEVSTTRDREGAAFWFGPDRWEPPASVSLRTVPRVARSAGGRGVLRMVRSGAVLRRAHPKAPHWFLMGLATEPARQRRGIGRALMEPALARCDDHGVGAYLETQKTENVAYYERFGFRVCGETDITRDGPHVWFMWRDPR